MLTNDVELDYIHFKTLRLRLPKGNWLRASVDQCRGRFIDLRWPGGPVCRRCGADEPFWLLPRAVFQCDRCRYQFSVTSGTILHRSRLDLSTWFRATAEIILHRAQVGVYHNISSHSLAEKLGVQYVAAHRMRKIILEDIRRGGAGSLSAAVCTETIKLPNNIPLDSEAHIAWLMAQQVPDE